jgi:hypothetical protein
MGKLVIDSEELLIWKELAMKGRKPWVGLV